MCMHTKSQSLWTFTYGSKSQFDSFWKATAYNKVAWIWICRERLEAGLCHLQPFVNQNTRFIVPLGMRLRFRAPSSDTTCPLNTAAWMVLGSVLTLFLWRGLGIRHYKRCSRKDIDEHAAHNPILSTIIKESGGVFLLRWHWKYLTIYRGGLYILYPSSKEVYK